MSSASDFASPVRFSKLFELANSVPLFGVLDAPQQVIGDLCRQASRAAQHAKSRKEVADAKRKSLRGFQAEPVQAFVHKGFSKSQLKLSRLQDAISPKV